MSGAPGAPDLILDRLAANAARRGDRVAFTHLHRGEAPGEEATWAEVEARARAVAAHLAGAGLAGRPVLLALPTGIDAVCCLLGTLMAGAPVAPAPAPEGRRALDRLGSILADLRPAGAFLPPGAGGRRGPVELPPGCLRLDPAAAQGEAPAGGLPPPGPGDLAVIQYTSGSLGRPQGVAVTHGNIAANAAMIREAFGHGPDLLGVSWLPLHHDMGLMGSVLQVVHAGGRCVTLAPLDFVQRPARWLRAVAAFGATTSGGPSFAYDLCLRHCADRDLAGLDLSRWRVAFCGAEPVRPDTLRAFARRLAPAGFSPEALQPCYGLAEATLLATSVPAGSGLSTGGPTGRAASCGRPFGGARIAILGPGDRPLPEGEEGEIAVAGAHVTPGLWDAGIGAVRPWTDRLAVVGGTPFLRTGDVGVVEAGDLFVLGRSKDVVIVRGLKVHAADVEATALAAAGGAVSAAAAFGLDDDAGERLVLVCEAGPGPGGAGREALERRLGAAVAEAHGLLPHRVALVRPGSIPRSASGKIRRAACRDLFRAGRLAGPMPAAAAEEGR